MDFQLAETFFVTSESLKSVITGAGLSNDSLDLPFCALQVGDVVSSRSSPRLFFRVMGRWLLSGGGEPPVWHIFVDQTEDPLDSFLPREHR